MYISIGDNTFFFSNNFATYDDYLTKVQAMLVQTRNLRLESLKL